MTLPILKCLVGEGCFQSGSDWRWTTWVGLVALLFPWPLSVCCQPAPQLSLQESDIKPIAVVMPTEGTPGPPKAPTPNLLPELLALAERNNPGLKAAYHRLQGALQKVPQVTSLEDPRLTFTDYLERTMEAAEEIRIMQMIPYPGKLELRGRIESAEAEALRKEFEKARLDLRADVKDAYYEYYYLEKTVRTNRENLDLLRRFERVAAARYGVGRGGNQDVIKAQVELGKVENDVRSLEDSRVPVRARLNAAMNRPTNESISPPTDLDVKQLDLHTEEVLAMASRLNPEIQALDTRLGKSRDQVALAQKQYFPDFSFGLNWMNGNNRMDSPPGDEYMAMVEINLPIYRKRLAAGVREAEATVQEVQNMREEMKNKVSVDLQNELYRLRNAERQIHLFTDILIPKARQSVQITETSYSSAESGFLELVDTQRELLMFQESYYRSVADYAQALAKIEALVGRSLVDDSSQSILEPVDPVQSSFTDEPVEMDVTTPEQLE